MDVTCLGEAVIGRVDDLEDLHRDDRVLVNDLQIFRRAIDIAGQLQNALHALGERGHAVNHSGEYLESSGVMAWVMGVLFDLA